MKTFGVCAAQSAIAVFFLASLCGTGRVTAQTATTIPVGFIKVTLPAAPSASQPSNTVISVPLYTNADFSGMVATVDGTNTLSLTGAAWTASQFVSSPHLVRFKSGTLSGRFYLITANTTSQLTIDMRGASLTGVVATSDNCEVLPSNTLATLFGSTSTTLQTASTAGAADNVVIWNGASWDTFYHNGTNWKKTGSLLNQNNTILYPDEGIFMIHRPTSQLDIVFTGTCPSTQEQTDLVGAGSTFMANRFPVDMQLSTAGIHLSANWVTGTTANAADNVFIWNGTNWDTYYHNGTNWKKSGSLLNQNTTAIPTGAAVFVTRSNAAASTLTQSLPYTF